MDRFYPSLLLLLLSSLVALASLAQGRPFPLRATWDDVRRAIDEFEDIPNAYVIVSNSSGILFAHQKGTTEYDEEMEILSASKWVSAVTIMKLVDDGIMLLQDNPQKYLDFWTTDPEDLRSTITLQNLLSFTSGYEGQRADPSCMAVPMELYDCAKIAYDEGQFLYTPGVDFKYGSIHLQIAGAMAEKASGKSFLQLFNETVVEPLGLKHFNYNSTAGNNPALAFGIIASTEDYHSFLNAYFEDKILSTDTRKLMELDYTPNRTGPMLRGYHYSLGNWFECRMAVWLKACLEENVHGSVGAFGFYPVVDRSIEYFFIIGTNIGLGGTTQSAFLRHEIKPLIDGILA